MEEKDRMDNEREKTPVSGEKNKQNELSETWAEDALADLEDFIEEQGIYIRQ